jgi:hypothetical protein
MINSVCQKGKWNNLFNFHIHLLLGLLIVNMSTGTAYTNRDTILKFYKYVLQLIFSNTLNHISYPSPQIV